MVIHYHDMSSFHIALMKDRYDFFSIMQTRTLFLNKHIRLSNQAVNCA